MRNKSNLLRKKLKAALYNPYLDVLGGGEKHILSILKAIEDKYEINIFWDEPLENEIKQKFSLQFINKLKWLPNIFRKRGNWLEKFIILRKFDLFFYVTDGSYFFSGAKKNFVFCMVPRRDLYGMTFVNRLKTLNFRFITNSCFTHLWLEKWGIKNDYIYPYINNEFISLDLKKIKKEKIIVSVGRFFRHLHAKRQDFIIESFKKLQQNHHLFKDFKLYLIGGLKEEDKNYFKELKLIAGGNKNIIFLPNASYQTLIEYYKKSMFYWHATGYGVDEKKNPEAVEHMGITSLEAIAAGCVAFCHNSGGSKEMVTNGINGFLYDNLDELINKTTIVYRNENQRQKLTENAKEYVVENFSYEVFKKRAKGVLF